MADEELIADFMRVRTLANDVVLEVAVVQWPEPHEPVLVWKMFRRWKKTPTPERLATARQKVLSLRRFFRVCHICGERNNVGRMHDHEICQICAEGHLGVVY